MVVKMDNELKTIREIVKRNKIRFPLQPFEIDLLLECDLQRLGQFERSGIITLIEIYILPIFKNAKDVYLINKDLFIKVLRRSFISPIFIWMEKYGLDIFIKSNGDIYIAPIENNHIDSEQNYQMKEKKDDSLNEEEINLKSIVDKYENEIKAMNNQLSIAHNTVKKLKLRSRLKLSDLTDSEIQSLADRTRKRNGKINYAEMGRKLGVDPHTVKREIKRRKISWVE